MITRTRQNWNVGSTVKVGFLSLRVIGTVATPGNYRPDEYALESLDGRAFYRFTPHHGIARVNDRAAALSVSFD